MTVLRKWGGFRRMLALPRERRCAYTTAARGTNHVANGLLLRANLHTLFDCHLLAVEPNGMKAVVAPSFRASSYGKLHGRALRPRTDGWSAPSAEALRLRFEEFERTHGKTSWSPRMPS